MIAMTCPYCGGRGWAWVGVASNAERVECEPCGGTGHGRVNWDPVIGALLVIVSALLVFGIIHFSSGFAYGETAGSLTLKDFRAMPLITKAALVNGAMATVEHLGMTCPDPQRTVGEYVSRLTYLKLDESAPWVSYFLLLTTEQGCQITELEDNPKEGA